MVPIDYCTVVGKRGRTSKRSIPAKYWTSEEEACAQPLLAKDDLKRPAFIQSLVNLQPLIPPMEVGSNFSCPLHIGF